jgi:glycosyltransferase involved in cell wall biosynthesis
LYTPNGVPFHLSRKSYVNSFYIALEKAASYLGGQVVSCSHSEQTEFERLGIKSVHISNGVQYDTSTNSVLPEENHFNVITVGRITDQKNPILFNQIASYFSGLNNFQFVWVGDGEQREVLTSRNIIVTGWREPKEVNQYLAAADLYLSTASYEGLPFSVLEALSMKKPVLLSECTGNRDLVSEGLNGDIYKSEKEAIWKIFKYYNNPAMLKLMGQYSSLYFKSRFLASETCNTYSLLYQHAAFNMDQNVQSFPSSL